MTIYFADMITENQLNDRHFLDSIPETIRPVMRDNVVLDQLLRNINELSEQVDAETPAECIIEQYFDNELADGLEQSIACAKYCVDNGGMTDAEFQRLIIVDICRALNEHLQDVYLQIMPDLR